ncbi:GNAT family N-acetyltransferase [Algoriphagus namhaensis]|uniref:GNAT family N-acetyltransferase n=1 Tax=Algoriphagus namhaensis TaxID=915353 RepID=A0ABV8AS61_9BACT
MPIDKTGIRLKKAHKENLDSLLELARLAFLQAFTENNKPENVKSYLATAFSIGQLSKELDEKASLFMLAELDDEIVGYVKVNLTPAQTDIHDPESLEIARLYVLEHYLGLGVGKILLDWAIDFAKQNQKRYVWLGVWEHNPRAIRFYEKNGFSKFGTHPFPFGDEIQTDLLMKKTL